MSHSPDDLKRLVRAAHAFRKAAMVSTALVKEPLPAWEEYDRMLRAAFEELDEALVPFPEAGFTASQETVRCTCGVDDRPSWDTRWQHGSRCPRRKVL